MTRYTSRWGLSILGAGDALNADGYKAVDADRRLIDRLLEYSTEQHHHTGITGTDRTPVAPPVLTLITTDGSIPAGQRYYYTYTIIDDTGTESAPAPYTAIDTPPAIATPSAPLINPVTGSGSLLPGTYSYVLSAYRGANSLETKAENSQVATIYGVTPGSMSLTLPQPPLGADGFNIYRKSPNGLHYLWITDIATTTDATAWVDDGSIEGDCDRSLPGVNRTSNENAVLVQFPGATPNVPDGYTWRIYRSTSPANWSYSTLIDITPIGDATPYTPVEFLDTGLGAQSGGPPPLTQVLNAPPKIELTNAAEVQGYLPPGLISFPTAVTFTSAGAVTVGDGTFLWVCPYDQVKLQTGRAYLGHASMPAVTDVIVEIVALRPSVGSDTWDSVFGPFTVPVGSSIGPVVPATIIDLKAGDQLRANVIQSGGGAPATDADLAINVLMTVRSGSTTDTYPWLQI
jgi:hypothetical protein